MQVTYKQTTKKGEPKDFVTPLLDLFLSSYEAEFDPLSHPISYSIKSDNGHCLTVSINTAKDYAEMMNELSGFRSRAHSSDRELKLMASFEKKFLAIHLSRGKEYGSRETIYVTADLGPDPVEPGKHLDHFVSVDETQKELADLDNEWIVFEKGKKEFKGIFARLNERLQPELERLGYSKAKEHSVKI
jgi:hypothetical protein